MVEPSQRHRSSLGILATVATAAVCLTIAPAALGSDTYERERAFFDRCEPLGEGGIEPAPGAAGARLNIRFFFLADKELPAEEQCIGAAPTIRHVVKNLHETDDLPFIWEGTLWSHTGLLPGDHYGEPLLRSLFEDKPGLRIIKYGTAAHLPNGLQRPALTWPMKRMADAPDVPIDPKDIEVLSASVNTAFRADSGRIEELSFTLTIAYDGDLRYHISSVPEDIIVAIGGFADSFSNEIMFDAFQKYDDRISVDYLGTFLQSEHMSRIPETFADEIFIIFPAGSGDSEVIVPGEPKATVLAPVAFLTDGYEPIATAAVPFVMP